MANPIVKINGERIHRTAIESWKLEGTVLVVGLVSGRIIEEDKGTTAKAESALGILDNLTEIDDIDGL